MEERYENLLRNSSLLHLSYIKEAGSNIIIINIINNVIIINILSLFIVPPPLTDIYIHAIK